MLRGPITTIRLFQISYVILVSVCITGSILFLSNSIMTSPSTDIEPGPPLFENTSFDTAVARISDPLSFFPNMLWAFIPLTIAIFIIAFYLPTRSSLGLSKAKIQKKSQLNRFNIPVRGYTINLDTGYIRVTRKLSSLSGLLLREMNFTVNLPLDYYDKKRIFDFLVGERVNYTKTHVLLQKTVKIRNIPLLIVRTKAIVATVDTTIDPPSPK
ncbi:hypothetical protein CEE45_14870 [Candidatus Heimdallarchaeota archaeon B3_Heim]|nr:MAG: hypothetical protein CEE45_14870 [Candidatus Heimdallarchaeota archaeon B3_Heim]